MNERTAAYKYNGVLFSLEKEWNSATCFNMDKLWRTCGKISQTQKDEYYDSIYIGGT